MNVRLAGLGAYLPERLLDNAEIEALAGFDARGGRYRSLDEWARAHHGGLTRAVVRPGQATSDLATEAARRAIADAGLEVGDVDLIVMATATDDQPIPPAVAAVQANLGSTARFVAISAACTGFLDAVEVAAGLVGALGYRTALVIAADVVTSLLAPGDWLGRSVFSDGAGAAVLRTTAGGEGFRSLCSGSRGDLGHYVAVAAGGSRLPRTPERYCAGGQYLRVKFRDVHHWAVEQLVAGAGQALAAAGLTAGDVDWLVPHQASVPIVREAALALGVPDEKIVLTYPRYGNTSGSTIPIALLHAREAGCLRPGQWLLMAAVGAGMSWAAATYRCEEDDR